MMITSKNSRVQDIYLLAKGHYGEYESKNSFCRRARILLANANWMELERFTLEDAALTIMNDCWNHLNPSDMQCILLSVYPKRALDYVSHGLIEREYWSNLIEALLSSIAMITVNDLKIQMSTPDDQIQKILRK